MLANLIEREGQECEGHPLPLLVTRLSDLMRLIRESGLPRYQREIGYKEIHRHLITMIGISGGLSSQEIVTLTGREKAQISRAIKPLEQSGLIERESLRAKLMLLPPGRAIYERIIAISRGRDATLTEGIAEPELRHFMTLSDELTQQAAQLYAEERQLSVDAGVISACPGASGPPVWPRGPDGQEVKPPPELITPRLIGLAAYLKRSAMLACQRSHGLSHFQWQVLSLIGEYSPLPLAQLIVLLGRDKSQVGRGVAHLEQEGLIQRSRPTRRRDIVLMPTEAGAVVYEAMQRVAEGREDRLWSGHSPSDRAFFLEIVARLTENARAMVTREKGGDA